MATPALSFGKTCRKIKISKKIILQMVIEKPGHRAYGLCTGAVVRPHKRRTGSYGFRMGFVRVIFVVFTICKWRSCCKYHHVNPHHSEPMRQVLNFFVAYALFFCAKFFLPSGATDLWHNSTILVKVQCRHIVESLGKHRVPARDYRVPNSTQFMHPDI